MKRPLATILSLLCLTLTMSAIDTFVPGRATDNWRMSIGGGVAVLNSGGSLSTMRPVTAIDFHRRFTPALGLGVEGHWAFNSKSHVGQNILQGQYLGVMGTINLPNAFAACRHTPRVFEPELTAGIGWVHSFNQGAGRSAWGARAGLNLNFNLGRCRQWTLSLRPAMGWRMSGTSQWGKTSGTAALELLAGISYNFRNSWGTHSILILPPRNTDEISALNGEINRLREELDRQHAATTTVSETQGTTKVAPSRAEEPAPVTKKVETEVSNTQYVFFDRASTRVAPNQLPGISMMARAARENPSSRILLEGYSSPDGNAAYNTRLATLRAEAVKHQLIKAGVPATRIDATGRGVGQLFDHREWNRVVKCTLLP